VLGAARDLDAAVDELAKAGIKAHGVMGSRGHGDLAGLVLSSTAHKVIHLADRPVLVAR
jgi:Universal stress protein family